MKGGRPLLNVVRITHFAMIDGAMMRVVRAAVDYEAAQYTRAERDALDRVVKAAIELKDVFVKVGKQVNEEYKQELKSKAAVEGKEINSDEDKRRGVVKP